MAKWSSDNVSSGGHVYDRTTGTWAGETQGSVGDGIDHGRSGDASRVIHDANGPVGVQFAFTGREELGAADPVAAQGRPGAGSGPAAGTVNTNGPASGGSGPGTPVVINGPGETGPVKGPLKTKLKPEVTRLMIGGDWFLPNPWFSNAEEWEARGGEPGDWLGGAITIGADVVYNTHRLGDYLGTQHVGPGVFRTEQAVTTWLDDIPKRVNGPLPVQEPVDWGQ